MEMTPEVPASYPLANGFSGLARFLMSALTMSVVVALIDGAHRAWGASSELRRIANTGDVAAANSYDHFSHVLALVEIGLLVLTGVLWLIWQRALAKAAPPGFLRRSPGWHVGSWFIPFASLVLPIQNIRDLWRAYVVRPVMDAVPDTVPAWVSVWWLAWILANFLGRIPFGSSSDQSLGSLEGREWWEASGQFLTAVAGILAVLLVNRLSSAALARDRHVRATALRTPSLP